MAKKGMRRPGNWHGEKDKNEVEPVPEIQGKAKTGNKKASRIE